MGVFGINCRARMMFTQNIVYLVRLTLNKGLKKSAGFKDTGSESVS